MNFIPFKGQTVRCGRYVRKIVRLLPNIHEGAVYLDRPVPDSDEGMRYWNVDSLKLIKDSFGRRVKH